MVPRHIIVLEKFPLTGNGKISRSKLAENVRLKLLMGSKAGIESDENDGRALDDMHDMEKRLAMAMSQVLGIDASVLSSASNFFALGGDSMVSLNLVSKLLAGGVRLSVRQIFDHPILCDLAQQATLVSPGDAEDKDATMLARGTEIPNEPFGMIGVQKAYWIGSKAISGDYSPHVYLEYAVSKDFERKRFEHAVRALVDRHEMLRAIVTANGSLHVLSTDELPAWNLAEIGTDTKDESLMSLLRSETRDDMLATGPSTDAWPLFDIRMSRIRHGSHYSLRLHISVSLFIIDGVTEQLLRKEIAALYYNAKAPLRQLGCTFRDYVEHQALRKSSDSYLKSSEYWTKRIPTLPKPPQLPWVPNATESHCFDHYAGSADKGKWAFFCEQCAQAGATPTAALISIYASVLLRHSSNIGNATSSRTLINIMHTSRENVHKDINHIVGNFSDTLLLEVDAPFAKEISFAQIARGVSLQLARDLEHSIVSGIDVMSRINKSKGRALAAVAPYAFTSTIGLSRLVQDDRNPLSEVHYDSRIGKQMYSCVKTPHVWIDHQVEVNGSTGEFIFNIDILKSKFPSKLVESVVDTYRAVISALMTKSGAWKSSLSDLMIRQEPAVPLHPPLSQRELDLKLGPRLSDRIMLAGNRTPDAVAVVDTGFSPPKSFTYRALAQRSWRVAEQLRSIVSGKPKPRVVAVVMHKGWEQVVGAVGVLRTHSVYLPIDASTPELRTTQILEASGAVAVGSDARRYY